MSIKIVSDSSSNLYGLEGVDYTCAPLKIITARKEYVDTPALDVASMVDEMSRTKGPSSTSCPNVHDWLEAYGDAKEVFAVTITSQLSGSYHSAVQAAEYEEKEVRGRVCVIDSLSAGPEMALLLEKLRELVRASLSFESIREAVLAYRQHTHLLFALQSLNNLAQNGRVSPAVARLAGVLGIRMIGQASQEGTLQPLHKCRGEKKTLELIFSEMKKNGFAGGRVRIAHCLNPESAGALRQLVLGEYPDSRVCVEPCTGLCSYYAEKGGLMIGYEDAGA